MIEQPIVISGFGRSGTTWLSDIISKIIGGLILFEPFHPAVYASSKSLCYTTKWSDKRPILAHLEKSTNSVPENPWLLRNHLSEPLNLVPKSFIEYIWKNSETIGFKTIRGNHFLEDLFQNLNAKILIIHRHPLAVLCSICNRKNFWKEYGWEWHNTHFFDRAINDDFFSQEEIRILKDSIKKTHTIEERIITMWAVSFLINERQRSRIKSISVSYESLYISPYEEINRILNFLNLKYSIHPSHIFVPSLTTLNTVHSERGMMSLTREKIDDLFWKRQLEKTTIENLNRKLKKILEIDLEAYRAAQSYSYI